MLVIAQKLKKKLNTLLESYYKYVVSTYMRPMAVLVYLTYVSFCFVGCLHSVHRLAPEQLLPVVRTPACWCDVGCFETDSDKGSLPLFLLSISPFPFLHLVMQMLTACLFYVNNQIRPIYSVDFAHCTSSILCKNRFSVFYMRVTLYCKCSVHTRFLLTSRRLLGSYICHFFRTAMPTNIVWILAADSLLLIQTSLWWGSFTASLGNTVS